jgi:hypothetical protein
MTDAYGRIPASFAAAEPEKRAMSAYHVGDSETPGNAVGASL